MFEYIYSLPVNKLRAKEWSQKGGQQDGSYGKEPEFLTSVTLEIISRCGGYTG
jgi:hypothetical protein